MKLASLSACLFCFISIATAQESPFLSDAQTSRAHKLTLDLQFAEARKLLAANSSTLQSTYVSSLSEALELLLTEDPSLFSSYEQNFEDRLFKNPKTADEKFLLAEMHLQWAFVYLKFGHELDAASHFRDAYKIATDCRRRSSQYLPIRKTTGMLEVMVGAVPEKYTWVMDLFGIHGSIENGLRDLDLISNSNNGLAGEARLMKSLIEGYVLQQPAGAADDLQQNLHRDSSHSFALGAASLFIKSAQSEKAYALLEPLANVTPIANYFRGEILLHRGDYRDAIDAYQRFARSYQGSNNLKDTFFKIGICYRLLDQRLKSDSAFAIARENGNDLVEADRSAARTLASGGLSHSSLLKVRYSTDGGYYDIARQTLDKIVQGELPTEKDRVEYYYRRARLEHGTNHVAAAKIFYQQVIDMAGNKPWYFAPNACLQMGYLALEAKDETRAKQYFKKALTYKNHEYKNSIDSKAKTALNRMKR